VGAIHLFLSGGAVAVAEQGPRDDPYSLHWKIDLLNQRLESVVPELRSSLVNGEGNETPASVQQYLEQVRNSMQDIARFYDKLSRLPTEGNYLAQNCASDPGREPGRKCDSKSDSDLADREIADQQGLDDTDRVRRQRRND